MHQVEPMETLEPTSLEKVRAERLKAWRADGYPTLYCGGRFYARLVTGFIRLAPEEIQEVLRYGNRPFQQSPIRSAGRVRGAWWFRQSPERPHQGAQECARRRARE